MFNNQIYGQRFQPPFQQFPQYQQPQYQPQQYQPAPALQGRIVDNVDVVKATEISLDGSVSYFPIADGSAIVTKQLQNDGTSKMVVYKPVVEETPKVVSTDELKEEITSLKKEIEKINKRLGDELYESKANSYEYDPKQY